MTEAPIPANVPVPSHPPDAAYSESMIRKVLENIDPTAKTHSKWSGELHDELQSFSNYDEFVELLQHATFVEAYEGLPHQTWEADLLASERNENETLEKRGFSYYAHPITIKTVDVENLRNLYRTRDMLYPTFGIAGCGGYHPDWCLAWENNGQSFEMEFCFGCGETRALHDDLALYCEMRPDRFEQILDPYHRNRPGK